MHTEKLRQHYIPKFYLRYFSYQDNKKQIGVYNIRSKKYIQAAKLKTQAYKPYYYGKDGVLEELLSQNESDVAPIINKIINNNRLPLKSSEDHQKTLVFLVLSETRNPVVAKNIIASTQHLERRVNEMSRTRNKSGIVIPKSNEEEAMKIAFGAFESIITACLDLESKLIINNTNIPFITSDIPLLKYNQYLEQKNMSYGSIGYGNIGIQLFLPLNPKKMVLFYDRQIYKIGDRNKDFIIINDEKEIHQFNILQMLNCQSNIFFNNEITEIYISKLKKQTQGYTQANETISQLVHRINENGEIMRDDEVVFLSQTSLKINLSLKGIKFTKNAKQRKFDPKVPQIRARVIKLLN